MTASRDEGSPERGSRRSRRSSPAERSGGKASSGGAGEPSRPARRSRRTPLKIGDTSIAAGTRKRVEIPVARLPATRTWVSLPVEVVHGRRHGPRVWLSAAIHGDELNGIEVIRRVLEWLEEKELRGSVLAVPIVNVIGFIHQSRYLPDRRDLNRCFPGSPRGSLASRLARIFMDQIVRQSTHGIDLHTASEHRTNLPQIRANLEDAETLRCARAFNAPVMIDARLRDGSLRDAASRLGIPVLLYEGGEPHRFNEEAIETGVRGVRRVLAELGMLHGRKRPGRGRSCLRAGDTTWVRAKASGLCRLLVRLGERVERRRVLAEITDPFGEHDVLVRAPSGGVVIGHLHNPMVRQGDGILHLATDERPDAVPAEGSVT